MRVILAV